MIPAIPRITAPATTASVSLSALTCVGTNRDSAKMIPKIFFMCLLLRRD